MLIEKLLKLKIRFSILVHIHMCIFTYLFINIVDADLLKAIVIKDFKSSNVKHSNVGNFLHCWVHESLVTLVHNNSECSLINSSGNSSNRAGSITAGVSLANPLCSNFQLWL